MFSNAFLAHILVMKFFFQIPLHRMAMIMRMQGLAVNEGALTGMLKKLAPLLLPLYLLLTEVNRSENHWHVDETGWMHFVQVPDKQGWHWWLWVFVSPLTVVFVLDPSRSSNVPLKHFGKDARGIMNCDRFSAYGKLMALIEGLVRALCWAHYRRDFLNAGKSLNCLKDWADLWVNRIAEIYRLNEERLAVLDQAELLQGCPRSTGERTGGNAAVDPFRTFRSRPALAEEKGAFQRPEALGRVDCLCQKSVRAHGQ
jgi:transposase